MKTISELLELLKEGGAIKSSYSCTPNEVTTARLCHHIAEDQYGMLYIYIPPTKNARIKSTVNINLHHIKFNNKLIAQVNQLKDLNKPEELLKAMLKPVIRVQSNNQIAYTNKLSFRGISTIVYNPESPLKCGAKCWIETENPVFFKEVFFKEEECINE